jgi:diguanylate cyclase (GGDEF)-like protein
MTTTDMMTKLKLKHYFYTVLLERMEKAAERGQDLSVLMLDIDHFKQFNDTYGHSCGDAVLKQVAHTLRESVRPTDLAARYGGEEFCVLLPDADEERAMAVAERVRSAIEEARTEYEGLSLQVTVSVGAARYRPGQDISGRNLIDRADKALYRSKQSGRNRVSSAERP